MSSAVIAPAMGRSDADAEAEVGKTLELQMDASSAKHVGHGRTLPTVGVIGRLVDLEVTP